MKKLFTSLFMVLAAVTMMAQQPVITFEKTEHDFGKINEADGRVTTVFNFKNEGMSPLILSNVRASCGCTTPTWTKEPVEPGQTGSITVTYNPNGRPGHFQKTITITSNATEPTTKLYIKGEVLPKPAKPSNNYNIQVGDLSMKSKVADLGAIKKGELKSIELEYANLTQAEHKVELAVNSADVFLINQVTLPTVKPNETGKFIFVIDSKKTRNYGPLEVYAYVVVDGKRQINDAFKLTIKASIEEDFSNLTEEQRVLAPRLIAHDVIELPTVAAGATLKGEFNLLNAGVDPLLVRRVYTLDDQRIKTKAVTSVKSGKKGKIAIEVNTKDQKAGTYVRQMVIITNDPQQPIKRVTIRWTIK